MFQADTDAASLFIRECLIAQLPPEPFAWVEEQVRRFPTDNWGRSFHMAFSAVPRKIGKGALKLIEGAPARIEAIREGWHPESWQLDQAVRILFLLSLPQEDEKDFGKRLHYLFDTADMSELTAIYAALPLLPYPESHSKLAAEGVRTNMTVVFDAVALHNPYPADYLDENAWNQLFLKAVFTGRPLYKIVGVEKRANAALSRIISDYAHERWAASREVTPEIWRPVMSLSDTQLVEDIQHLFSHPDPLQQTAAALICLQLTEAEGRPLLEQHSAWQDRISREAWNWEKLGKAWEMKIEA